MEVFKKQRYISTTIWSDDWFDSLSHLEKLFYFYLLSNPYTNIAGVYPITERIMRAEMDISKDKLKNLLLKFEDDGKVFYHEGYIILPNWLKHQRVGGKIKSGTFLGVKRVLNSLPASVRIFISQFQDLRNFIENLDELENEAKRHPSLSPENKGRHPHRHPPENGETPPIFEETPRKSAHELELELELKLESKDVRHFSEKLIDSPQNKNADVCENLSAHFINLWQSNGEVFNFTARIQNPKEWLAFWEKCAFTREQIETAVQNFVTAIKSGKLERRFIPHSPDAFVLNGNLQRYLTPYAGKHDTQKRIESDQLTEDEIAKYFVNWDEAKKYSSPPQNQKNDGITKNRGEGRP